jgi:uncharacterized protein (TIGR03435 family)
LIAASPPSETDGPSILVALQVAVGLKLESKKVSVMTMTVDLVEKPVE